MYFFLSILSLTPIENKLGEKMERRKAFTLRLPVF